MPLTNTGLVALPAQVDLSWPDGDTVTFTFTFTDEADAPIDLSGGTFHADIEATPDGTVHEFTIDATDAGAGVLLLTTPVTEGLPANAPYDLRREEGGHIKTLAAGNVSVSKTISAVS